MGRLLREAHRLLLVGRQLEEVKGTPGRWRNVELLGDVHLFFEATERSTGRSFAFKLDVSDFDVQPPSFTVVDSRTRRDVVERARWPTAPKFTHSDLHPKYKRPWTCLAGLREFHTHPMHLDDPWDRYRYTHTLSRLLENIVNALEAVPQRQAWGRVR